MKAVFEVQTVDRETGAENWVRVHARNGDEARAKVVALGEVVGQVRLAEVVDQPRPAEHGVGHQILRAVLIVLLVIMVLVLIRLSG